MKCPSCGAEASGKFCSSCGGPLKVEKCSSCGAPIPPGAKFCNDCGKALSGGGKRGSAGKGGGGKAQGKRGSAPAERDPVAQGNSALAWWVAGAFLVVALVALGYPVLNRGSGAGVGGAGAPPGMGGTSSGGPAVDLTTMSLDQQGTILFNRVMASNSNGDAADVEFFLPKALVIYEQLDPSDSDRIYHYALLYMVGVDYEAALAKAQQGLADVPDYLLLLGVAAEASVGLGDTEAARGFYTHLLEIYDTEMGMTRDGYDHHQPMFPAYREAAQAFLNQG